ncbi:MAG: NAD(P)H-hydrate dehydratase [Ruminococcus sp.]|nr:NAD(P)H-hydrate dehydratase [Ruminococcus sp.]
MKIVNPEQMKMLENESEKLGVSKKLLMENAGRKLAEVISGHCRNNRKKRIVFLVGTGNNGGDCLVSAGILSEMGYKNISIILVCGMPKTELSQKMYGHISERININDSYQSYISEADILVDGVFGTGFHGELSGKLINIFSIGSNAYRIAVDVPSGADSRTGKVSDGTFKADETVAFGCIKTGMTQYPLRDYCGKITVADIGIPEKAFEILGGQCQYSLIDSKQLSGFPPVRKSDSHKGTFGKVLIIAGSSLMRGAAFLSVMGALRSGAGLVSLATVGKCIDTVSVLAPESTFIEIEHDENGFMCFEPEKLNLKNYSAIVIGCGMGVTSETTELTKFVVQNSEVPVIIDADGINYIASDIDILLKKKTDIIITPHTGEMSRLMKCDIDEISANRFDSARKFAEKYDITVVLKGAGTVIADKNRTAVNPTGNAGMSRGGSGDILAGIIGAIVGQGYSAFESACAGVYIHGLAGDVAAEKLGHEAMLPRDILGCLSDSFGILKEKHKNSGD